MKAKYRDALPQLDGAFLITDGGLETDLIFHHGFELPGFASFPLLATDAGHAELTRYYDEYVQIARQRGTGLLLEAMTWRANPDWGVQLGYTLDQLDDLNRMAIAFLEQVRENAHDVAPIVISGNLGPRGDGYVVGDIMDARAAQEYHARQVEVFADTAADLVSAFTMTYADEAIGIVRAARAAAMPVVIAFTVETDGRLPSGQALGDAISHVDGETDGGPVYYMVNCAHPTHFEHVFEDGAPWIDRIRGLRANASTMSHAELDEAETLDDGDPRELADAHRRLQAQIPALSVLGGCCGTDHRHVSELAATWLTVGSPS